MIRIRKILYIMYILFHLYNRYILVQFIWLFLTKMDRMIRMNIILCILSILVQNPISLFKLPKYAVISPTLYFNNIIFSIATFSAWASRTKYTPEDNPAGFQSNECTPAITSPSIKTAASRPVTSNIFKLM